MKWKTVYRIHVECVYERSFGHPIARMKWRTLERALESSEWPSIRTGTGRNVKFNSIHANDRHTRQLQMCRQSKAVCGHGHQHEHPMYRLPRALHSPLLVHVQCAFECTECTHKHTHAHPCTLKFLSLGQHTSLFMHTIPLHPIHCASFRAFRTPLSILGSATSKNQPGLIYFTKNLLSCSDFVRRSFWAAELERVSGILLAFWLCGKEHEHCAREHRSTSKHETFTCVCWLCLLCCFLVRARARTRCPTPSAFPCTLFASIIFIV